jgi:hypothetical protein
LKDEQVFQRAVQTYTWIMPALNMYGMKEGSEKVFEGLQRPPDLEIKHVATFLRPSPSARASQRPYMR